MLLLAPSQGWAPRANPNSNCECSSTRNKTKNGYIPNSSQATGKIQPAREAWCALAWNSKATACPQKSPHEKAQSIDVCLLQPQAFLFLPLLHRNICLAVTLASLTSHFQTFTPSSTAKYVIKPYHNVYTWEGRYICIQLRSHRLFLTYEFWALQALARSKRRANIRYAHAQAFPQDGVCLGAASYTQVTSQWRLRELQGAQHFWKAEHLYLDS